MKLGGLILITMVLVVILAGTAGAHVYNPDKEMCWTADNLDETDMEWGDTIEVYVEHLNATYTIELIDFDILDVTVGIDETKEDPCADRKCDVSSDADYANLRIYKDLTLIGSYPFKECKDCMKSFCTKESGWDTRGRIWNDGNDFFIGVDDVDCDFAKEDCFCTDPIKEHAKVVYCITKPPEFETTTKLYCMGVGKDGKLEELHHDHDVDSSIVRSNSMFKAEIEVGNKEKLEAYHVDATVSLKPVEMIKGEYPPDCTVEKIYKGKVDGDDIKWIDDKFPIDLRSDESKDWFDGDGEATYTVHFKTPSLPQRTKYVMEINLTYEDFKERKYQFTDNSTTIEILPVLEVKKAIGTEDYMIVAGEAAEAYIAEITYVIYEDYEPYVFLTVINWGDYEIPSIRLSDAPNGTWHRTATTDFNKWKSALPVDMLRIPEMGQDKWDWDFSLGPGKVMTCAYPVSLMKPGTYKLGSAAVNWTEDGHEYSVVSYSQKVEVHGPYIVVTKTVDPATVYQNGTAKIVVRVKNDGDRPASVKITDQLPMECELIGAIPVRGITIDEDSGVFSVTRVLESGAEELFEYEIDPNRTVMLPPAVVEFVDITQYAAISVSEMPILIVDGTEPIGAAAEKLKAESEKAAAAAASVDAGTVTGGSGMAVETSKTPVRREPGFAGILAILACLAAVLISKRMRKD
jgi:hypothetical protein